MAIKFRVGLLVLFIVVAGATVLHADEPGNVNLLVGRSTVIDVGTPISRVSLTSPDVADALVTSPAQLLVHGKTPGAISMFIWDRAGAIRRYDVIVQRDLSRLATQVTELFPGEHLTVQGNGRSVVVAGTASSKFVADKAVEVAAGYVEKKDDVVNLVQVQTGAATNQVLLHVRFAEVNRNALTELGASLFTSPLGIKNTIGRTTTQQFSAPGFDELKYTKADDSFGGDVTSASGKFTFSDFLNLFVFSEKYDLGAMIRLLQTRGLFESLAEPNLVAESGKEASFLAGGEIPIPIAQGTGGNVAISVQWKEFGIRLNFTPTVIGDRINLKVRPEVSTLDFTNAIVLQGFRVPALSTRRAETEIELTNRQTFAIAGLINNAMTQSLQKIPGIGDIPILGYLFKSKAAQKEHTELVVMITPEILPPGSRGVTGELPRLIEPYLSPVQPNKTFPQPPAAFQPSGSGAANVSPTAGTARVGATPDAATAAAAVSALTPQGTKVVAPSAAGNPLTKAERNTLERAQQEDRARTQSDLRKKAEEDKRDVKLGAERQRKDREDQERLERQVREGREREAKLARIEKERRDRLAQEQARRDAEAAKRQAEVDREHQKQIDEAAAKLKAAEQAYQAEVGKRSKDQSASSPQ
jgi:pilus assembly protein CpaC